MSWKNKILSVIVGGCLTTSVSAQEHPDFIKLVEDTADYIQVAQEYVQQAMTMMTDAINTIHFDFSSPTTFGSASELTDAASKAVKNSVSENVNAAVDGSQESAELQNGTEEGQEAEFEEIAIKKVEVTDSDQTDILASILSTSSLPPIVPEEIVPLLEEEQPDPVVIKDKIAEIVLIDKSNPDTLYVTQDLQNRLVGAGVMRALDNAKRSFELSDKAAKEIEKDRKKVEESTTFTGILWATASTTVHSYQKLNEIKGLYAQMMELDALGSLLGAELTPEEREKRAEENMSESIGERDFELLNSRVYYNPKSKKTMNMSGEYVGCVADYVSQKYDRICQQMTCSKEQKDDIAEAKFNIMAQVKAAQNRYLKCTALAKQASGQAISVDALSDNKISGTDDQRCIADLQQAMIAAVGYSGYMSCYNQGKKW